MMKIRNEQSSRRKFIQQSIAVAAGLMLAGPARLFAEENIKMNHMKNIISKGYAGNDKTGKLKLWNFERRAVGDNDILIDIKFSGICHSDIHTIDGHWGEQVYPQI